MKIEPEERKEVMSMTAETKRVVGKTMHVLLWSVMYVAAFGSFWGILVERGWTLWDAFGAASALLIGGPLVAGFILLANHLCPPSSSWDD